MELKYDKNNQLLVRLAILESQLECAKNQIELLKKDKTDFWGKEKINNWIN